MLLLFYTAVQAQSRMGFTRFSTDEGLASNVVNSVYQDAKGFIWVGTANGLQRYDGSKFIQFGLGGNNSEQLPVSATSQIIGNSDGSLWLNFNNLKEIGLFSSMKMHYRKIPVIITKPLPSRAEYRLVKDSNGNVYLVITQYGLLKFDEKKQAFTEEALPFALPKGWLPNTMTENKKLRQLWIGTDSGLIVYDATKKKVFYRGNNPDHLPLLDDSEMTGIKTFYIDHQQRYWLTNWTQTAKQKAFCYNPATGTFTNDTTGLFTGHKGYVELWHFYQLKNNTVWAYGLDMLMDFDKSKKKFNNNPSNPFTNYDIHYTHISQMFEDREGNVWIASDQGLYFFCASEQEDTGGVMNFIFKKTAAITSFLETAKGEIWLGKWGSAVEIRDKSFIPIKQQPNTSNNTDKNYSMTWALHQQKATGKIWVGCQLGRLMIIDTITKQAKYFIPPAFENRTIRTIAEDKQGLLWFGTQGGNIVKFANDSFTVVQKLSTIIYKITVDNNGVLWVGTHEKGLYAFDTKTGGMLQHFQKQDAKIHALYNNTIADIEVLNDSIICVATDALNLINIRTNKVQQVTVYQGLPSNSIRNMQVDHDGFLWIITANGLCRYNYSKQLFTQYGKRDGMVTAELVGDAGYTLRNGNIIFGGNDAALSFYPKSLGNTKVPPDVTITDFKLLDKYIPVDSLLQQPEIILSHEQNSFTITFASLSFLQRDKLVYYYKMEGVDDKWIQADAFLRVNYTYLPSGRYTFMVKCETNDGIASKNITKMWVYIKPPFWRTWWFVTMLLVLIGLIIYDLHNSRVKRLLAVEKIRTRVARDLHDDMGSTLSTINILSAMAKAKVGTDTVRTSEYISKITDNCSRMMEAMDDIVWSIKPNNDSMQKITARMREFATNVLEAKDIELHFSVDEKVPDVKLNMETRRDLFLLYKEAVNNIAKYSKCTNARVKISVQQKQLHMVITDDGIGFDPITADSGNGLGNIQKRADAMKGKLQIQSAPGKGSCVHLSIPVK